MTTEELTKKLNDRTLKFFEGCVEGILKNIDNIRTRMCDNRTEFVRGFHDYTGEVFKLIEYHQLMLTLVTNIKNEMCHRTDVGIITTFLKEEKENYINELLRAKVVLSTTDMMHNIRNLYKIEAYQMIINAIQMQINRYEESYYNYHLTGKVKEV